MTTQHKPFVDHFKLVFFLGTAEPVRVEVTPKAMIQCFDADMTPQSFLEIYQRHQAVLRGAAMSRLAAGSTCIVLDTQDFDAFTLQQQSAEALNTPITLRPAVRTAKPLRRDDSFAPARSPQDARFGARLSA